MNPRLPPLLSAVMLLAAFVSPTTRAQSVGATMITALTATQGQTLNYTVVITNGSAANLTGVTFSDPLDPNTTLVAGSLNTSPLAFPDSYPVLGNVQITIAAPGVLANDVDPDGVGPALTVTATNFTTIKGGSVSLSANGSFTYNPPPGFEGTDTFTYTLNDGEGFTDTGTVSLSVTGMIWFVNSAAIANGDGRLANPFNSLAAFAAFNNGSGNNPAAGDNIFLYSGTYTGPVTLVNNQKLIGQGATASLAAITGLTPPAGSLALPATGGARPNLTGANGVALASANTVRGLNLNVSGGTALSGLNVGALAVTEAAIGNTSGGAVNLANGTLAVALGSVAANGGVNGIRLMNCAGSFTVSGDGALARNGTGGTIQNSTGNGVHLDNAVNVSLARMNINACQANGLFGQNLNGLVLDWCSLDSNGDAANEGGIRLGDPVAAVNGLIGTAPGGANPTRIANTLVRASGEMNVAIFNNGGTLSQLEVTNVISKDTRTRPLGADGFVFEVRGSGTATVNFSGCSFTDNFTQGMQASALAQSVLNVNVNNCGFTNNNEGIVLANANDADLIYDLNGNRFFNNLATGASGSAIAAVNATTVTPAAVYSGKIRNNTISGGGIDNHLVIVLLAGIGQNTLQVANNNINAASAQFSGIYLQAGETGSGSLNANVTVTGNTVSVGPLGYHGIMVQSRITSLLCAEISGNVSTTGGAGLFGINVRQRDTSTFSLPGFAGPLNSTAAVIAFLQGKNPGTTAGATVATTYSGGSACVLPLLAMARETQPDSLPEPGFAVNEPPSMHDANAENTPTELRQPGSFVSRDSGLVANQLSPILAAARQRWADTGLGAAQLAVIDSLRFEVVDLAGWYLGASSNRVVRLDRRANGYGWFIGVAPADDVESPVASGRIDLLTAVLHEMGHNLGLADDYTPAARDNVMYGFLTPGTRRLPVMDQAREAVPDDGTGTHFMFTPLNIGTIPAGKSIAITFRVNVANPVPPAVCVITNQGLVTAGGGISFPTDDPRTGTPLDATLTTLLIPPLVTTQPATSITDSSAILNGLVTPCGTNASYYFQYGTSAAYGNTTTVSGVSGGAVAVPVNAPVGGLPAGATYHFRLVATNAIGTNVGADLTFTTLLTITGQPANAVACVGGTATFSVTASSPAVTYQWQQRAPDAGGFQNISNATNSSYTTPPVTPAADGTTFRVIVSAAATNLTSTEAVLSVISITAPTVTFDFNSGLPPGTAIYGNAYLSNGVLELNPNVGSQNGAFLTTDLAPGRLVRGFVAAFKVQMIGGTSPPADGFSFNWATDLPNGIYPLGEEGTGSGLRISFDTFDNGFGEAPAIDVFWGTNLVAHRSVPIPFLVRGPGFVDVQIRLSPAGLLDVTYGCEAVYARLPVSGYTPQMTARFGIGSRTGGLWETHTIDDLALQLSLDPTNGVPRITSISKQPPAGLLLTGTGSPNQNCSLEASTDLGNWTWRANVVANAGGFWQFVEPNITLPPYRFYRVRTAPQFPPGLVTWWRAQSNHLDSFGPNNGAAFGVAPGFTAGQRGAAFSFNGTNQAMFIGSADIPPPWTAAFWVNRQDAVDVSAALLTSPAAGLKLEQWPSTRQVGFTAFGIADYYFNTIVPTNTWTHLTFVGAPSGTILYVNGTAQETNTATISLPMNILGSRETGLDHFQGLLDETTIFDRALSPAEIEQVRNATRGP